MTPEEEAAIIAEIVRQQMMADPVARSGNDFGQGPGYLGLEDEPDEWKRLADLNDLVMDRYKMTGTYMSDYVPGLYEEVEDPGEYTGYRPDSAALYQNNQAVAAIQDLVDSGMSFTEATEIVADRADTGDGEGITGVPTSGFGGQVDREALRAMAAEALTSNAQYEREYGDWERQAAEYEDFTRPRTNIDMLGAVEPELVGFQPGDEEAYARSIATQRFIGRGAPAQEGGVDSGLMNPTGAASRSGPSRRGGQIARTPLSGGAGPYMVSVGSDGSSEPVAPGGRNPRGVSVRPTRTLADRPGSRKSRQEVPVDPEVQRYLYSKFANEGNAEIAKRWNQRAAATPRNSKEQDNIARLNAAYNVIHGLA